MPPFELLIKPVSAGCNLACDYCYYAEHSKGSGRMSDDVLEHLIRTYLAVEMPVHTFVWQGGEPLLAGIDFFRKAVSLQIRHGRGRCVANAVQTNATLIDDEWADFFERYQFLIGCSLDGPPEIHDRHRRFASGKGSHDQAIRGMECLARHGVPFNVLTVVGPDSARSAQDIYRYLAGRGFSHQQYIPSLHCFGGREGASAGIGGVEWGGFLSDLCGEWSRDGNFQVSVRHFDAILAKLADDVTETCSMGRACRGYFVVEAGGDIYPCEFFVTDALRIGDIREMGWEDVWESAVATSFSRRKSAWHESCGGCSYLTLCAGDCQGYRLPSADGTDGPSVLCEGWKMFFDKYIGLFEDLARRIQAGRSSRIKGEAGAGRFPCSR